jgi:hypothetical protein
MVIELLVISSYGENFLLYINFGLIAVSYLLFFLFLFIGNNRFVSFQRRSLPFVIVVFILSPVGLLGSADLSISETREHYLRIFSVTTVILLYTSFLTSSKMIRFYLSPQDK